LEDKDGCCDPRQAFITDLENFITSPTVEKITMLYLEQMPMIHSDEIGDGTILGLVEMCGLIDVMASMNPDDPPPFTRCDSKR
jgi:hypothetical protein